jgi:hypothetical protein
MNNYNITRRSFLRQLSLATGAAACAPLLAQCSSPTEATREPSLIDNGPGRRSDWSPTKSDIELTSDREQLVRTLKSQYEKLKAMALDESQRIRIVFAGVNGPEALIASIVAGGAARYRHVRLVRESTGETVNLLWGQEGIHPSIKLADDAGQTIVKDGKALEFSFGLVRREGRGPRSWLELGIKIAAIALLVWLGASILKPIIAGIAFIAFNAMVIGIVIAGVALMVAVVRWILGITGWTLEDVAVFFRRSIEELKQFLAAVITAMET